MNRLHILPLCALGLMIAASAASTACDDDKRHYVPSIGDGDTTPTLATTDVRTFVSDSGYTRFFIQSPLWEMYEDAAEPYWFFPDGLELEEYDRDMKVIATLRCDTARYLSQKRLWRLKGNVVMVNTLRDSFLTQLMFWDQNLRKVYSDSFVHIVREGRIIEGYGFESNENITEYTIHNPTGIIPNSDLANREDRRAAADTVDDTRRQRRTAPPPRSADNSPLMYNPTP